MGYQVARRAAEKLRRLSVALLFLVPIALLLWLLTPLPPFAQIILAVIALASATAGVLAERWLFFAEAEHVVVLYSAAEPHDVGARSMKSWALRWSAPGGSGHCVRGSPPSVRA